MVQQQLKGPALLLLCGALVLLAHAASDSSAADKQRPSLAGVVTPEASQPHERAARGNTQRAVRFNLKATQHLHHTTTRPAVAVSASRTAGGGGRHLRKLLKLPIVANEIKPETWLPFPAASDAVRANAGRCLHEAFQNGQRRERIKYSQVGEDGILEAIFACIGTTDRTYAEFGVENGTQCTSRWLREHYGFTGLMMDGGNFRPEINLQQEMMDSENIAHLLTKHGVPRGAASTSPSQTQPHPSSADVATRKGAAAGGNATGRMLDQLTVDVDQNTFWLAAAVLEAGFRPRSLVIEFNRNLGPFASVTTYNMPREMWVVKDLWPASGSLHGDCYFGASATAVARLAAHHGYELVALDALGINAFFVHVSTLGAAPAAVPYAHPASVFGSMEQAIAAVAAPSGWDGLHAGCPFHVWLDVGRCVNFSAPGWQETLRPVVLGMRLDTTGKRREFYEIEGLTVPQVVQHAHTASPFGSSPARTFGEPAAAGADAIGTAPTATKDQAVRAVLPASTHSHSSVHSTARTGGAGSYSRRQHWWQAVAAVATLALAAVVVSWGLKYSQYAVRLVQEQYKQDGTVGQKPVGNPDSAPVALSATCTSVGMQVWGKLRGLTQRS